MYELCIITSYTYTNLNRNKNKCSRFFLFFREVKSCPNNLKSCGPPYCASLECIKQQLNHGAFSLLMQVGLQTYVKLYYTKIVR